MVSFAVTVINASVQLTVTSFKKITFGSSCFGGGGSVVSHLEKNIEMSKIKTGKILIAFIVTPYHFT